MLLGLPTTIRFFAGQGGGFQNGSGPKTNFFKKKKKQLQGIISINHTLNHKVLGSPGLGGELQGVTGWIWGPREPSSPLQWITPSNMMTPKWR